MTVVFDTFKTITGVGVTTLTTAPFTIASSANRAGALCLSTFGGSLTISAGSIGGVSGAEVTGTDSGTSRAFIVGVVAPPSGSQTAAISWDLPTDAVLGVITASGVNQGGVNAGTFNN